MQKSAAAKLQTRNLGTSILLLENIKTKTTVPFPNMAHKNTIQTPQRNVHQSNRSWQGRNGPGSGRHCIFPGVISLSRIFTISSSEYSSIAEPKFSGYVTSVPWLFHHILKSEPNFSDTFST